MKFNSRLTARARRSGGFTLVELMLVLVILATLAAIVLPKLTGRQKDAKIKATQAQIAIFEGAIDTFEVDNGDYPTNSEGLEALMEQPQNMPDWHGPYLNHAIPPDPWGTAYQYTCPGKINPSGYDIISAGPDQQFGTDDDITNSGMVGGNQNQNR